MTLSNLEILKFNLQENQFPYFSEEDLTKLLTMYPNVNQASYEGCMIKAHDDSVKLGPINTPNNEKYWLRRANQFKRQYLEDNRKSSGGVTSWKRADE